MQALIHDEANDGVLFWEIGNNYVWLSNALKKLLGYGQDELVGMVEDIFHTPKNDDVLTTLLNFSEDFDSEKLDKFIKFLCKDGSALQLNCRSMVVDGNNMRFVLCVVNRTNHINQLNFQQYSKNAILSQALVAMADMFFVVDKNYRFIDYIGFQDVPVSVIAPGNFLGKKMIDIVLDTQVCAKMMATIDLAFNTNASQEIYYTVSKQSKQTKAWYKLIVSTINNIEHGQVAVCVVTDVTHWHENTTIQLNNVTALEHAIDGVAFTGSNELYTYMNFSHAQMYGYTVEELVGKSWRVLYAKAEQDRIEATVFPELFATGKASTILTGLKKNESTFLVALNLTTTHDGGIVCISRDITEVTAIKNQLEQSNILLHKFSKQVPCAIYEMEENLNGELAFVFISDDFKSMFPFLLNENGLADTVKLNHLLNEKDAEKLLLARKQSVISRRTFSAQFRLLLPDTSTRWYQISEHPSVEENGTILWFGSITDISQYKFFELAIEPLSQKANTISSKYESLLTACNLGAWEHNIITNGTWCSKEYFNILGLNESTFLNGKPYTVADVWENLIHPDDLEKAKNHFQNYLNNPIGIYEQTFRMKHANGQWIWIWSRGKAINKKLSNEPSNLVVGTHLDVTHIKQMELDLQKSKLAALQDNALLRSILNSPQDIIIFALDSNFCYIGFTKNHQTEMRKVFGAEIAIGMCVLDINAPEAVKQQVKTNYNKALAGEFLVFEEVFENHQTGEKFYYENHYSPINAGDGTILGLTVFVNDISKRKNLEIVHQESKLRYKALFTCASDAIFIADIHTGLLVDANKQACELVGKDLTELTGQHVTTLHPQSDAKYVKDIFSQYVQNGGVENNTLESSLVHVNGKIIPVLISMSSVFTVGDKSYSAAYMHDLSKSKAAENKIANVQRLLKQAEKITHTGSIEIDLRTGERVWSDELYRILGFEPLSVTPTFELFVAQVHTDDRAKYIAWFTESIKKQASYDTFRLRIIRKNDGTIRSLSTYGTGIFDENNQLVKIIGIVQDITDKVKLETDIFKSHEQLQKLTKEIPITIIQLERSAEGKYSIPFISKNVAILHPDLTAQQIQENPGLLFNKVLDEDNINIIAQREASANNQSDLIAEFRVYQNPNTILWVKLVCKPEFRDDGSIVWYGYFENITRQKEMIQALEKQNKELKDVAWLQSHVVRAPLARLIGLVQAVQKGLVDKEEETIFHNYILESANELDEIVKRIVYKANAIQAGVVV